MIYETIWMIHKLMVWILQYGFEDKHELVRQKDNFFKSEIRYISELTVSE